MSSVIERALSGGEEKHARNAFSAAGEEEEGAISHEICRIILCKYLVVILDSHYYLYI